MRANDLKKKYPELWDAIELSVLNDCAFKKIEDSKARVIASNAAFVTCSAFDCYRKAIERVVTRYHGTKGKR